MSLVKFLTSILVVFCLFNTGVYGQQSSGSLYTKPGDARFDDIGNNIPTAYPDTLDIATNNITIEAWIYPIYLPDPGFSSTIMNRNYQRDYSVESCFYLSLYTSLEDGQSKLNFFISDCGDPETSGMITSNAVIPDKVWTHVAVTFNGSQLQFYINGVPDASITHTGELGIPEDNAWLHVGSAFDGLIDDLRLWNIARSEYDINLSKNAQLNGTEERLVGYWPMNKLIQDYGGTFTPDSTTNENHLYCNNIVRTTRYTTGTQAEIENIYEIPLNFGVIETGLTAPAQMITVSNSGDLPLYGKVNSGISAIQIHSSSSFFVDPHSSYSFPVLVTPIEGGDFNASNNAHLIIDEGNAINLGVTIPIEISAVNLHQFDANNIAMWVQRNGTFAYNPYLANSGLEWEKGSGKHVVFRSGFWVGAKINDVIHTAVSTYHQEFSPGPINEITLEPEPDRAEFRVYKINRGDNNTNPDYGDWPEHLGAPMEGNQPKVLADQTLFTLYNDADPSLHFFGSEPLGAEVQQLVYGYNEDAPYPLNNTVFLHFKLINRSEQNWHDTYFAIYSDPDIGDCMNDLVGIDTLRNMAFAYNGTDEDNIYGTQPPAVGYDLLDGALSVNGLDGFSYYTLTGYPYNDPNNSQECYEFLSSMNSSGQPLYTDEITGLPTTYPLSGDPTTLPPEGWIDEDPADRRFLITAGPFTIYSGDTEEMLIAVIVAQGTDRLNSIVELRAASDSLEKMIMRGELEGGAIEGINQMTLTSGETSTLDDIQTSGSTLEATASEEGAVVEMVTYDGAPVAVEDIQHQGFHGTGEYIDINIEGELDWPVTITTYYTAEDLAQADISEDQLAGMYYYNSTENIWILYSESGEDDHDLGTSTTEVNTENVTINDVLYEGTVTTIAYHLTTICLGSFYDPSLGIKGKNRNVPDSYSLSQNYPNPFNPVTHIEFQIPNFEFVTLSVYNLLGQKVATVVNEKRNAGFHQVEWDAGHLASGIYYYMIKAAEFEDVKKMILLR